MVVELYTNKYTIQPSIFCTDLHKTLLLGEGTLKLTQIRIIITNSSYWGRDFEIGSDKDHQHQFFLLGEGFRNWLRPG